MIFTTVDIIIIISSILISAFFSGAESALFSLKKSELHRFSLSADSREKSIYNLMKDPQKILITILIGNLFVNTTIAILFTDKLLKIWGHYGHIISMAIVTPLIILFCEITPKILALNNYQKFAKLIVNVMNVFHYMLYPVRILLLGITNALIRVLKLHIHSGNITEEELSIAIDIGTEEGALNLREGEFLKNVLRFSKQDANNVMIPRNKAVFIPYNASIDEALDIFKKSGVVRAPVYKNNLDNIVGKIDSKDLLPYAVGYRKLKNINKLVNPIDHFPATKGLNELLQEFLHKKIQIGIALDEYGGTAGVVYLGSILTEIVGMGYNAGDIGFKPKIEQIDNGFIVPGNLQLLDFNHYFDEHLLSNEAETIGGYIIEQLEHFPVSGEKINIKNFQLTVLKIIDHQIIEIEMRDMVKQG